MLACSQSGCSCLRACVYTHSHTCRLTLRETNTCRMCHEQGRVHVLPMSVSCVCRMVVFFRFFLAGSALASSAASSSSSITITSASRSRSLCAAGAAAGAATAAGAAPVPAALCATSPRVFVESVVACSGVVACRAQLMTRGAREGIRDKMLAAAQAATHDIHIHTDPHTHTHTEIVHVTCLPHKLWTDFTHCRRGRFACTNR